ncbi:hypothetical protein P7C73_g4101, partial [Tremellales sp. Uapishka_1]
MVSRILSRGSSSLRKPLSSVLAPAESSNMPTAVAPSRHMASTAATKSAKPLYASQSTIPHLPIPTLSSTLHKYQETLVPILTSAELAESKKAIQSFLSSPLSETLQKRLQERAASKDSWLSEWWNETAYMGYRGRIIPNVSYFYIHKRGLGKGQSQEDRAAELIRGVVEFKKLVDGEILEPEKVKGQPLCMASYRYLFNATRVPTSPADTPLAYPSDLHHIVVLRNNRYFKVDTKGRGKKELADAFKQIKKIANEKEGPAVGVLTAEDRDVWTAARRRILGVSSTNVATVQAIESAILLVCLDDGPPPTTDDGRAWSFWAGGYDRSPKGKGRNRWFDKHEFIVDESGESGFNGEHSLLDGTPTLRMNEFVLAGVDKGVIPLELPEGEKSTTPMPAPEELNFELDGHLRELIKKSQDGFAEEIGLQDLKDDAKKMVHFTDYGKNLMKTNKASPDAWVQMVMQLAFFRLFSRPGVTYESCQTRKFLLGRTEVIRSVSSEAKTFCEAMVDPQASDKAREEKFRKAVSRHIQYSVWAADAQGVDRHLFGLKKLLRKEEEVPALFSDKGFSKSNHWEMSTSQLGSKYMDGWGYGEVVPDGYGLSYSIDDDSIRWCVTTMNNDAEKFGAALQSAADELRQMLERSSQA